MRTVDDVAIFRPVAWVQGFKSRLSGFGVFRALGFRVLEFRALGF